MNEQWKLNGDCEKCRKKSYCSEHCKAYRENISKKYLKRLLDAGILLDQLKIPDNLITRYKISQDI